MFLQENVFENNPMKSPEERTRERCSKSYPLTHQVSPNLELQGILPYP